MNQPMKISGIPIVLAGILYIETKGLSGADLLRRYQQLMNEDVNSISLYTAIRLLREHGFVSKRPRQGGMLYSLTPSGKRAFLASRERLAATLNAIKDY